MASLNVDRDGQSLSSFIPRNAASVTPNDSADLSKTGTLYVGTGGDVKVDLAGTGTITFSASSGEILPVEVKKVYSTGTTASGIVVLY